MEIIYLLVPLALVLVGLIVWGLTWAIRSGQFEDLEGPAYRILMDEDEPQEKVPDAGAAHRPAKPGREPRRD